MCSTFSQLQENLPLNVDEVIQTEEIRINVGSRIKMNKLGVQIREVFHAKEKFVNENTDATHIPRADILAWSRDKIAAMKANASNVPEKPVASTEYDYRIPITKSTQKLLSSHKRKKSPKREQAKSEKQTKRVRKDRTPQRLKALKTTQTKSTKGSSIKSKKGKRSNQPVSKPSKVKVASTSKIKETSNKPGKHVSTCISSTQGICITKIDTLKDNDIKRCVTEAISIHNLKNEENNEQANKTGTEPELPEADKSELNETLKSEINEKK